MLDNGHLRITTCMRAVPGERQQSTQRSSMITRKVGELTAMKIDMHTGPQPDILQLSGQAQHTLKSSCITELLKTESAYMMESVVKFIGATDDTE